MYKEEKIKTYLNGNFEVSFFNQGGRIIKPLCKNPGRMSFPNGMDVCITKECDNNCPFCYNSSNVNGKHCDVELFENLISTYTGGEIALGGGDIFTHPDLERMLVFCKDRDIFVSITVNQNHLSRYKDRIIDLLHRNLIKGIGVSLINPDKWDENLYKEIESQKESCITIHVIAGILDTTYFKVLKGKKVLILGYKDLGRGKGNIPTGFIEWLKDEWLDTMQYLCRRIIFDNLAIKQLDIKSRFKKEDWEMIYQGDDGDGSMYIDLVDSWYGESSIVEGSKRHPLQVNNTIKQLYDML